MELAYSKTSGDHMYGLNGGPETNEMCRGWAKTHFREKYING